MEHRFFAQNQGTIPASTGLGMVIPVILFEGGISESVEDFLTTPVGQLIVLTLFVAFLAAGVGAIIRFRRGKRNARMFGIISAVLGLALLGFSLAMIFDQLPAVPPSSYPTPQI